MDDFERRIKINEHRILIYKISPGYAKPTYAIMEGFIVNGKVIKTYRLSQWDDYGFRGWINSDKNVSKISFEFDKNHPLYLSLFHLLNYDKELIIEDDDTIEDNKKYIRLQRKRDNIYLEFIDKINVRERFYIFIKNICPDIRSKIDRDHKDTKLRLSTFFNEINEILMNDYYQISIEEYLLNSNKNIKYEKMAKVFKRKI